MTELRRALGPVAIWALGVGYVISGMYFGWNLGLAAGGILGMLIATGVISLLYIAFVLTYAELASATPRAGGAFVYATTAFGRRIGLLAGIAQWTEFVFAPPAIAAAIGAYFQLFFPRVPALVFALGAYAVFTAINIVGVALSAMVELLLTALAVFELVVYLGVTAPHFSWTIFYRDPLPHGAMGILAAVPFAVWFYLGIEGIANVSEEAKRPSRDIPLGFSAAMATLVVLAFGVLFGSVGVGGWAAVVYPPGKLEASDSPLPLALARIVGQEHVLYHMLVLIGLFGLVASFHGIVLAAGRVTMEFGRVGYAPRFVGTVHRTRHTPVAALLGNLVCGVIALLSGKTSEIISLSALGALTLYFLVSVSQLRMRRILPDLARPFRVPWYPFTPVLAAVLSLGALVALVASTPLVSLVFLGLVAGGFAWFFFAVPSETRTEPHAEPIDPA